MKLFTIATFLCLAPAVDAFVAPPCGRAVVPNKSARQSTTMMASPVVPAVVTKVLQSSIVPLLASGVAEPGSVDAPGWVLPLGAASVILTAGLIPLLLKVCACVLVLTSLCSCFFTFDHQYSY